MERVSCLHFDLSLAMAIHSSKSFEMPLLLSAFSNAQPQVICGQPIGRECDTQPVSNCRGARLMAHGRTCDVVSPTKNPITKVTVDVKNAQATEETRGSDMVAEGMMEVHTAHATSTHVMETSKALK